MRTIVAVGVWMYMVLAVLLEVGSHYMVSTYTTVVTVVLILAASQAAAIVAFYMQLKDEPGSMKLFAIIPIMFLSALIIAMLASLG